MKQIEYYRRLKGLSQRELAKLCLVSQPKISLMESKGVIHVGAGTLASIARAIDFPYNVERLTEDHKEQ